MNYRNKDRPAKVYIVRFHHKIKVKSAECLLTLNEQSHVDYNVYKLVNKDFFFNFSHKMRLDRPYLQFGQKLGAVSVPFVNRVAIICDSGCFKSQKSQSGCSSQQVLS